MLISSGAGTYESGFEQRGTKFEPLFPEVHVLSKRRVGIYIIELILRPLKSEVSKQRLLRDRSNN
jgi:hypothetical protein